MLLTLEMVLNGQSVSNDIVGSRGKIYLPNVLGSQFHTYIIQVNIVANLARDFIIMYNINEDKLVARG